MTHQYYFEKLHVWQDAVELAVMVHVAAKKLPAEEKYNLSSQLRRAALSVSSNIAEGSTRKTSNDYSRFINIAYGSAIEVLNGLLAGHRIGYFDETTVITIRQQIAKITNQLRVLDQTILSQAQKDTTTKKLLK